MRHYDNSATDQQRAYLTTLCNRAFAKGVGAGQWAGLDSRAAIRSESLTKASASAWIAYLKDALTRMTDEELTVAEERHIKAGVLEPNYGPNDGRRGGNR